MRKVLVAVGMIYVGVGALCISMAPDTLSMLMVGMMCLILAVSFMVGIVPATVFNIGFRTGMNSIERALEINADSEWVAVNQIEYFFHQKTLDRWFFEYKEKVRHQQESGMIISDIETVYNEEALALRCWHGVMVQIPGTLTALGLLGTFLGLIMGISSIGFSTVEAALSSITVLLQGIETAFYTSIVGVILSILFNITFKFLWSSLIRSMKLFEEEFHKRIQPEAEEQLLVKQQKEMEEVLERLDRIPKDRGFSLAMIDRSGAEVAAIGETGIMSEIRAGLEDGEFIFWVQPKCNLGTRQVIGGEALIRWNHKEMGLIPPGEFLPILEKNGFIVKVDQVIWEKVCIMIRKWINAGIRPVPVSVNISTTDILSIDVAEFFANMVKKYRIPPQNMEIEIAYSAYVNYSDVVLDAEKRLRQNGFKVIVDGFNGDRLALNGLKGSEADAVKFDMRFCDLKAGKMNELEEAFFQARKIYRNIVAEGIENTEQMTELRRLGCIEGQGYYLYKPMDCEQFEELVKRG